MGVQQYTAAFFFHLQECPEKLIQKEKAAAAPCEVTHYNTLRMSVRQLFTNPF